MKIAIAGYGVEGKANYSYWNHPENDITIVDEREALNDLPENVKTLLGLGSFERLDGFDLVVRTAGLAPHKIKTDGKIWSSTNEFFAKCPAPIIGVTGTKGKGTTCSLIASILQAAGKTVHLVGNIGTPALDELPKVHPDDIVVYELSSFQLWDFEKSPHVAVVLGIERDHLDVHVSMDEYVAAKENIAKYQVAQDKVIFNKNNTFSRQIAESSPAEKIEYPFDISNVQDSLIIPGRHNVENASAAIAVSRLFQVDDESIRKGLASFKGLPHRLKFVAEKRGVKFYDDSIATTPGSTIAAIESFDAPKIVLIGGREKGSDYTELMRKCAKENVLVVAYGENRDSLKELCDENGVVSYVDAGPMDAVVATAVSYAKPGDVVILSPAAASFDMFDNYADRGDQFIAAVEAL
jgi:UDP-N-acetylmuramoylalanine--D-glutamate ligase